jgi:hypothetical protein
MMPISLSHDPVVRIRSLEKLHLGAEKHTLRGQLGADGDKLVR